MASTAVQQMMTKLMPMRSYLTPEGWNAREEKVGDDTDGPHVGGEGGALSVDNLGSDVLGLTVLELDHADDALGQREVADLDLGGSGPADQEVQGSEAEVAHALGVHVLKAIEHL